MRTWKNICNTYIDHDAEVLFSKTFTQQHINIGSKWEDIILTKLSNNNCFRGERPDDVPI